MNRATARRVRAVTAPAFETDPDFVARYLEDAAHYPGGRAQAITRPANVEEISAAVQAARSVLAVGAQSSLTGGATPAGDVVLSTERLQSIEISSSHVTAEPGVTLESLQQQLAKHGTWLPPVPTFLGATAGGAVSTNAAGAATFKYGTTRDWVAGVTVVLADGAMLELTRGEVLASDDGAFEIETASGSIRVDAPRVRMPDVPKCSAGYFAAPRMDLVDLFVGSEGTLGVIANVTFKVQPKPAGICLALVPVREESRAIDLVGALRRAARATWNAHDPHGIDIAAIEHIDRRTLAILKEDGVDRRLNIGLPPETDVALLIQIELSEDSMRGDLWTELGDARSATALDTPLTRFCRRLDEFGTLDDTEIVLPSDAARRAALIEFRESAPASVNRRVALARSTADGRIHKTAADSVVPFDRFADMMRTCRRLFEERDIDVAVWGHISDGNVHPNVVPRSYRDIEDGRAIILELGREVVAMGGSPLAEHGVGRSPLKQQLLRLLYGDAGIESMQRVKLSLDPDWKLARGVLFAKPSTAGR